jgi:hypothetical protein
MKPSQFFDLQMKVIKNALPESLAKLREMSTMCEASGDPDFVRMGRELAMQEAVFAAMGGLTPYFDLMERMGAILALIEKKEDDSAQT